MIFCFVTSSIIASLEGAFRANFGSIHDALEVQDRQ